MNTRILSLILLATLCAGTLPAGTSSLVYYNSSNELEYAPYANRGQSNLENHLPDFSHSGYMGGGVALPDVPIVMILEPVEGDNHAHIQGTIDTVAGFPLNESGFRGAILLKAGLYPISQSLNISSSGIVLRGEGQYPAQSGGTELYATGTEQYDLVRFTGSSSTRITGSTTVITDEFVGSGATSFTVGDASGLAVGDLIRITMKPNSDWIDLLGTAQYGWTPDSYELKYERFITAIEGNLVTVHAPLVQPIEQRYGGAEVVGIDPFGRISQCGIENLWMRSAYTSATDESHAWSAVRFQQTDDCWARNITAQHFGYACVILEYANYTTVQDSAMLDPISQITGGRRYSFNINNGSFNLFQRCYARGGRHDAVTGSRVAGPNTFLDVLGESNYSNSGPHHRHATGSLFDRVVLTGSAGIDVENRKSSGTGHGWAGAQTVFWNCIAASSVCDAPPGQMNFNIGFTGAEKEGFWGPEEPPGIWESQDNPIDRPHSLYLGQLEARLGTEAVEAIATEPQLAGDMDYFLREWAGMGPLATTYDELCQTGRSFFGGCRSDERDTFFGLLTDMHMYDHHQGYLYRYDDNRWFWLYYGSNHDSLFLWSFTDGSYHWTGKAYLPWYWDYKNGQWGSYETNEPEVIELLQNGDFENGTSPWNLYAGNGASANLANIDGEAQVTITVPSDTHHHIQLRQTGINLENGKSYKVTFKARAEAARGIRAELMLNVSPFSNYAREILTITESMTEYSFTFRMNSPSDANARFRFTLGGDSTTAYFDDVSVVATD
ncbi:MAG: carbohydrate binding domain-containing protein [Puniceicoccaceae bacterium]